MGNLTHFPEGASWLQSIIDRVDAYWETIKPTQIGRVISRVEQVLNGTDGYSMNGDSIEYKRIEEEEKIILEKIHGIREKIQNYSPYIGATLEHELNTLRKAFIGKRLSLYHDFYTRISLIQHCISATKNLNPKERIDILTEIRLGIFYKGQLFREYFENIGKKLGISLDFSIAK